MQSAELKLEEIGFNEKNIEVIKNDGSVLKKDWIQKFDFVCANTASLP